MRKMQEGQEARLIGIDEWKILDEYAENQDSEFQFK